MFEEIVTEEEIKFNNLEKKIFKFVCNFGCLIIKLILESYDRKIMKARDTKKYRHKGLRKNTIKTVMGEVEYVRAMYEVDEEGIKKRVYLLDEKLHINTEGKASENLIEKIVETVPITDSTSPIIVFIVFFLSPLCLYFFVSLAFIIFRS